jgi:DNA-directed RNA polymerase specialized sigma24 family protein
MYITPERLKTLIEHAQATGEITAELVEAVTKIAQGRVRRAGVRFHTEDYVQECLLDLCTKLHHIDPSKNAFAYITTMCWHRFLQVHRSGKLEAKKLAGLTDKLRCDKKPPEI